MRQTNRHKVLGDNEIKGRERQTTILLNDGATRTVNSIQYGPYAVWRTVNGEGWSVGHVPTGITIMRGIEPEGINRVRNTARQIARWLALHRPHEPAATFLGDDMEPQVALVRALIEADLCPPGATGAHWRRMAARRNGGS